jgi:hypothetical protein
MHCRHVDIPDEYLDHTTRELRIRVYKNSFATVKHQIQQVENPTPAMVISVAAAQVKNTNLHDYYTSEVALEELEIGSTDPNILIDNNCRYNKMHLGCREKQGL